MLYIGKQKITRNDPYLGAFLYVPFCSNLVCPMPVTAWLEVAGEITTEAWNTGLYGNTDSISAYETIIKSFQFSWYSSSSCRTNFSSVY